MTDLVAITYANDNHYHLHRLLTSAAHWGIPLQVLGLGEPWRGFLHRLAVLRKFIEDLADEQLVLCSDGYDAIYLQPAAVISERFQGFSSPVVFSAEMSFHAPGNEAIADRYPESPTIYRYLNAGAFIGRCGPLKKILARVLADSRTDEDQSLLSRYFLDHPGEISLDYRAELFVTTSNRQYDDDLESRDGRLFNRQTGTWPCLLHTPGGYYGVLEYYSRQLPFYRAVEWSRLDARTAGQIAAGYLNLRAYRLCKRWGLVSQQDDFSCLLRRRRSNG